MTADHQTELLRRVVREEVAAAVREALAAHAPPDPHRRVLRALGALFGTGVPFLSSDVAEALQMRLETRRPLREALHLALGGKAPTPARIGQLLRGIVDDTAVVVGGWRLVSPAAEGNSRVWMLERVGD